MKPTTTLADQVPENPVEWFRGWWHGIAVGFICGLGAAIVFIHR